LIDNTPDEFNVKLAIVHLEGKALQWNTTLTKTFPHSFLLLWSDFTKRLIKRFGNICDDHMAELMRLRQRHFMTEYHEEFDSIITILNLSDTYVLRCFLGGLKKDIQMIVRMFQPPTVSRAFALARMYEAATLVFNSNKNQRGVLGPAPTSPRGSQPNSHTQPKFQRNLTPAYMSERIAKGLCYFCDEPYSMEHSLVHKKLQIHVMKMDNDDITVEDTTGEKEEPTQSGEPQISVNALTGVTGFQTMRITGYYHNKPMHNLIDSGGTHNFLDAQVAKKYGCTIEQM